MDLQKRLLNLLGDLNVSEDKACKLSEKVIQAYSDPSRHYHGVGHIEHCLRELDLIPQSLNVDRQSIELAIWYHDVVHSPGKKDNEERSARCFEKDLSDNLEHEQLAKVIRMIRASTHQEDVTGADLDLLVFLDIDMSILGQPLPEFRNYEKEVRTEYRLVPRLIFLYSRKRLLRRLLTSRIFKSDFFYEKYEAQARKNISGLLKELPYSWI